MHMYMHTRVPVCERPANPSEVYRTVVRHLTGSDEEETRDEMRKRTVVLTTFPTSLPPASIIDFMFLRACFACASTPPSTFPPTTRQHTTMA